MLETLNALFRNKKKSFKQITQLMSQLFTLVIL